MIAAITSYRARNKAEDNVIRKLRRALFSHQFLNFDVWIELHFHRLFFKKEMNKFYPTKKQVTFLYGFFFCFCFKMWLSFSHILPQPQRLLVRVCDYVVKWKCMRCSIFIFLLLFFFLLTFLFIPADVVAPNLIPNFHYRSFHFLFTPPPPPPPTIPFIVLWKFVNRLSY